MAAQQEEWLSEAVKKYSFLFDKADRPFKDKGILGRCGQRG